ncbi:MAG: hypothetical protein KBT22_12125 [Bacteroidales bacterium]|nr:hypothetical protein [Candidatus Scybalocola fimicaballi]
MTPVWIINLNEDIDVRKRLAENLRKLSREQRHCWRVTNLANRRCARGIEDKDSFDAMIEYAVREGQRMVNYFLEKGFPFINLQVSILGNAEEKLTQQIFHLLPSILEEKFGNILSLHLNRGLEQTGFLCVKESINQSHSQEHKRKCVEFLDQLNAMMAKKKFARVVLYQENQYVANRFYCQLQTNELTDLLFQYLLSVYFCGENDATVFGNDLATQHGYYSLGAASVFYDGKAQHDMYAWDIRHGLLKALVRDDNLNYDYITEDIKDDDEIARNVAKVSGKLKSGCDLSEVFDKLYENPDPHPVDDFYRYNLLRDYFQTYLKHLPSTLVKRHQQISYSLRYKSVDTMMKNREAIYERAASTIRESASYFIGSTYNPDVTLPQTLAYYDAMQEEICKYKERAKDDKEDMVKCPKFIKDFYLDFKYDEGRTSEQRNIDIVKEISAVIDSEPPLLGLLTRTLMTSITVVIAIVLLIPFIKDYLPDYRQYVEYDSVNLLYMIFGAVAPWFYSIGNYVRNCKYIRKLKMMLLANTLLEVNRNMRQDYEDQVDYLYNDLYDFCSQQKRHVQKLINKAKAELAVEKPEWWSVDVKETMFNQHLTQAKFGDEILVKDAFLLEPMLYLNRKTNKLSELTKEDYKNMLQNLFADKYVSEIVTLPSNQLFDKKDADYEEEKANEDYSLLRRRIAKCFTDNLPNVPKDFADFRRDYGDCISFRPLYKMAELNGMFVTTNDEEPMLLRAADKEFAVKAKHELFEMDESRQYEVAPLVCKHHETDPYLFVVTWQKVEDQIDWRLKCNYDGPVETRDLASSESYSSYRDELFNLYLGDVADDGEFTPWDDLGGINYEYKA